MRYSAKKDDAGFEAYQAVRAQGKEVRVLLDGVAQKQVITADDELGTIWRFADDQTEAKLTGDAVIEELKGAVSFELFDPE